MNFKKGMLMLVASLVLTLVACGSDDASSSEDSDENVNYSEEVEHTIVGIEPGAGISVTTEKAIEEYDSLSNWTLETSSTAAMITELEEAINAEEPIIVTGWNPHWMFAQFPDMKYLEDPKGVYGEAENLVTLAREGFENDHPEAFKLIDQFKWTVEDMEQIMYDANQNDEDISTVAEKWVEDNEDKVSEWTDGVGEGDGSTIELASTPWDSERASSSVLKIVLEQQGFEVNVTPVDPSIVFESVANGDADATAAAWLPFTHADFYESVKDDVVDLGPNLEGAKIGLVVPSYMDIDSIEDLESAE